jgi:hypothetical protein
MVGQLKVNELKGGARKMSGVIPASPGGTEENCEGPHSK